MVGIDVRSLGKKRHEKKKIPGGWGGRSRGGCKLVYLGAFAGIGGDGGEHGPERGGGARERAGLGSEGGGEGHDCISGGAMLRGRRGPRWGIVGRHQYCRNTIENLQSNRGGVQA